VVRRSHECDGADGLPVIDDAQNHSLPELLLVEVPLEDLVPAPLGSDVRPHCRPFDSKSEFDRFRCLGQAVDQEYPCVIAISEQQNHGVPSHSINSHIGTHHA
jgi:hypothetical protein